MKSEIPINFYGIYMKKGNLHLILLSKFFMMLILIINCVLPFGRRVYHLSFNTSLYVYPSHATSAYISQTPENLRVMEFNASQYVIVVTASVKEDERGGQGHTSASLLHQSAM
jgi:hypothetical protein